MSKLRPTALELTLLAAVAVVVIGAALIGGGDGKRKEPATQARERPTARIRVGLIERRVERLRGLRFLHPLEITFASRREAVAIYKKATASDKSSRQRPVDEEELKLLGLLQPNDSLRRYVDAIGEEQVLGFYDDHSKHLVVVKAENGSRGLQEITLSHELTHALEDQHFGVEARRAASDDVALAETALVEGTATALMTDYADRYMDLQDALDALGALGADQTKLPGFVEDTLLFPYERGARFVDALRAMGGWRRIDDVYRKRRPRSTEQVLHVDRYLSGERPQAVRPAVAVRRVLGRQWRRVDATDLGEFDLHLLFQHVGGSSDASAEQGWGGGGLELWREGRGRCDAPCFSRDVVLISLVWDTRRDRVQGEAAWQKVFEHGLEGERLATAQGVGLWSSRGGALGLRGSARATVVVLAPSAAVAARLLLAGHLSGVGR